MPYDDFSDPQVQQTLNTMPEAADYQFDARALYQLLRRKALGRLAYNDLNNNLFDTNSPSRGYGLDDQSMLFSRENPNVRVDPLNQRQMADLYQLEDASPFKMAGFARSGPAQAPASDYDKMAFMAEGQMPQEQIRGGNYDPYNMQLEEPSMAMHAARKQVQPQPLPAMSDVFNYLRSER